MSDPIAVSRRLVAVFAADVEGYSLMGSDEVGTLKGLTERRAILDRFIGEHRGRIANTAGDSVLAEFGSAVDAVQCAVEAQTASLVPDKRLNFYNFRDCRLQVCDRVLGSSLSHRRS
jgi:adenylate cyclase